MVEHESDDNTRTHIALTAGTMVSYYRIVEKIGAGGMGEVYLAEDTELDRKVALKFLPPHMCADDDCRARFRREAQAVAKLNHPNVITIHQVSEYQGRPFFAMELVEGQSLRDVTKGKSLGVERIIELAIQMCDGLAAAHNNKVVHRDIKPSNIVIDSYGRPKILDFGLAAIQDGKNLTKTGSTLGTIRYMSPEQVGGEAVDQRSDLFSLGVVLYELITGRTPFERENDGATLRAIVNDAPEPLARYKSDIPDEFQRTISKLLEKDISMRYQNAAGVISDLKPLVTSSKSSMPVIPVKQERRWPLMAGGLVVLTVLILAGIKFWPENNIEDQAITSKSRPMVAVIPFENLGSPEDEYFAAGMTDEITSRLAGIPGLGIISRTSAKQYANTNKSLKQIGRELGVDYILEGTVRWSKIGDKQRVRITPQLIRVSDDLHIWAENYERQLTEVFAVQSDIAINIVEALGVTLLEPDKTRLSSIPTNNLEAYDYYLKGKAENYWEEKGIVRAIELFEKAVDLDPDFAEAYAEISNARINLYFYWVRLDQALPAKDALDKALAINPNLPQARLALGFYLSAAELNHTRALEEVKLAEKYLPNYSDVHKTYSFIYKRQGKWELALEHASRALLLNPRSSDGFFDVAYAYAGLRNYDQSYEYYSRAIELDPGHAFYNAARLNMLLLQGADSAMISKAINSIPDNLQAIDLMFSGEPLTLGILGLWRFRLIEFDSTNIMERVSRRIKSNRPHLYWTSMGQVCDLIGLSDMANLYYDSARAHLEKVVIEYPTDFHQISELGLIYSMLGRDEEAIKTALHAKEVLPMSSCYW